MDKDNGELMDIEKRRKIVKELCTFIDGNLALKPELKDRGPIKGHLHLVLSDKNGKIKDERHFFNTITVRHDAVVADRMAGGAAALIDYMGVGTTSGGKTTASTALEAQIARVQNDSNTNSPGVDDNDVVHIATFPAGTGTGALIEAGLFTDAGAGATLMAYQDFSVVNKGAGDTLTATWTVTYGAS